jgi:hypothetical protein
LRRSAAFPFNETLSIPNCRKQSARVVRAGSFISTNATRAEAFLVLSVGITAVAKALSIGRVISPLNLFCIALSAFAKWKKANPWVPRSYYQRKAKGDLKFLAKMGRTREFGLAVVFARAVPLFADRN